MKERLGKGCCLWAGSMRVNVVESGLSSRYSRLSVFVHLCHTRRAPPACVSPILILLRLNAGFILVLF